MTVSVMLYLPRSAFVWPVMWNWVFHDHTRFFCFWSSFTPGKQIVKPGAAVQCRKPRFGIKPVHGIDDGIAKYVFDKCVEKNGYVYVNRFS